MSVNSRADALIDAMQRLTELFRHENEAIRARNVPILNNISERKPLLVRTYEDCVRSLRSDTETLRLMDSDSKSKLKKSSDDFVAATLEHARLVRAATQVTQSTVNTLVSAINKARADEGMYTRRGGTVVPAAYARRTAPSMAYNKSF